MTDERERHLRAILLRLVAERQALYDDIDRLYNEGTPDRQLAESLNDAASRVHYAVRLLDHRLQDDAGVVDPRHLTEPTVGDCVTVDTLEGPAPWALDPAGAASGGPSTVAAR